MTAPYRRGAAASVAPRKMTCGWSSAVFPCHPFKVINRRKPEENPNLLPCPRAGRRQFQLERTPCLQKLAHSLTPTPSMFWGRPKNGAAPVTLSAPAYRPTVTALGAPSQRAVSTNCGTPRLREYRDQPAVIRSRQSGTVAALGLAPSILARSGRRSGRRSHERICDLRNRSDVLAIVRSGPQRPMGIYQPLPFRGRRACRYG